MNTLRYMAVNVIASLLRVFPLPCKSGLMKIGDPGKSAPVFLTCNYLLTVEKVKRALRGTDAYLLVANSRGFNVWCAATGGHFTHHDVISVLKTRGIEKLVGHRRVILPQLAATGIEAQVVLKKSGWQVVWGPVYAKDIPAFIENAYDKRPEMREVEFPWTQRFELAVAWAFSISVVSAFFIVPLWREAALSLIFLIWALSLLIFLGFPLYSRWLSPEGKRIGFVFFDFGRGGLPLILWAVFMLGIVVYSALSGAFAGDDFLRWGFVSFFVVLILSLDLMGSTPVYKSGLHGDRLLAVVLDEEKCSGAGFCEQVCPRNCFEVDRNRHMATRPGADQCVQCGACIVQCPFDALYFKNREGKIIPPETTRKFKLNLLGQRLVKTDGN